MGKNTSLNEMLNVCAEETITEAQVSRVLGPVLGMIGEGRFDKIRRHWYDWLIRPLMSMTAIVILIIIVWLIA